MIIIVGLGNPGKEYVNTPHNVGFEALDYFAGKREFPEFVFSKKFNALVSEKEGVILVKPQTFMNNSGQTVKSVKSFYKSDDVIAIHDDIDLPLGEIKISVNRGSAGHKGVESIIKELGGKEFKRIRIGVSKEKKPDVLKKFRKEDKEILRQIFEQISIELEKILK